MHTRSPIRRCCIPWSASSAEHAHSRCAWGTSLTSSLSRHHDGLAREKSHCLNASRGRTHMHKNASPWDDASHALGLLLSVPSVTPSSTCRVDPPRWSPNTRWRLQPLAAGALCQQQSGNQAVGALDPQTSRETMAVAVRSSGGKANLSANTRARLAFCGKRVLLEELQVATRI